MYILVEEDHHGFYWDIKYCSKSLTSTLNNISNYYNEITHDQYLKLSHDKIVENVVDNSGEYVRLIIEEIKYIGE